MTVAVDTREVETLRADMVVVGGGAAGVATATVAARNGLKVVMVERHGFCGGGAVAGHSGTVCGLYEASDSPGNGPVQVVFGFADEFTSALAARGGLADPVRYGKTYTRVHDRLCCTNPVRDSSRESSVVAGLHEQTHTPELQDQELAGL